MKKGGDLDKSSASPIVPKVPETLLPSLIVSIEELSPPFRSSKGKNKGKFVSNFWDNPRLAVAKAHNVILMHELKCLSSIESHDLVTQHLHKSVQVRLGIVFHVFASSFSLSLSLF